MITATHLLRDAARTLPVVEAEYLLEAILQIPRHLLFLDEGPLPASLVARYRAAVRKAAGGTPVQYLVRSAPFLDLDIYVDRRVLIPRPETEELVLRAVSRIQHPRLIVDYGTGSGCIATALARMFPHGRVVAVDSSRTALQVCRRNVSHYGLQKRVRLVQAESLSAPSLRRVAGRVDLLISNPPYIPSERIPKLSRSVRNYEPLCALDGGPEGTKILTMILELGPGLLSRRGLLALEIDSSHHEFIKRQVPQAVVERDFTGCARYAFIPPP
ncbi:MAG: peptide chain release factor N(5)-glutamine methyltransferase [candidate division WOR-3 bacterium]